ncbi:protein PTHB1-like [Centruroides sculpturatus]|uniref:protein PTHB1-like n=1 Tax=Centruroides sculpturatus TaxID=218467 RepID=UPI000C6DBD84|nr:protein PTHB1-like [Centruroides sculpturatus]
MSLFKARDWWTTNCGNEDFDKGCLCVANIDNNNDQNDKIIVGSHNGTLRVYQPHPEKQENGKLSCFQPDELLLERQLNFPIIDLAAGRFTSASEETHLAVLHPRKLSVYAVTITPGAVDHGTYYHLSLLYEHKLQRSAYCLVIGPFGEVKGKDFMCVQSLDGTLTFFEQESFAFSRFLPGFLLPGPLKYLSKTDSFVTVSAGWNLESYRFQILAVAKDATEESENITYGKRVMADWTFSLGEAALDIAIIEFKTAPSIILVLGERSIFAFKQNGVLKYIKKLDYNPCCLLAYQGAIESTVMMLIATYQFTLLIYQDMNLRWAAQLPFNPVSICRGTISNIPGMMIILSDSGELACCYLGTEPSLFIVPVLESREIDFMKAEQEMHELRKIIKATNNALPGNKRMESELSIVIVIPPHLDTVTPNESFVLSDDGEPVPSITAKIQLKTTIPVQDVRLIVNIQQPLVLSQSEFTFSTISEYSQVMVSIQMKAPFIPSSLKLHALAVYTNSSGAPRITESIVALPLQLVAKVAVPMKTASYKVTIDTNKQTVSLHELFAEFSDPPSTVGNVIGFEFHGGQQVSILASKTSQRYRIQSDYFAALWLFTSELIQRLSTYFKHEYGTSNGIKFSYTSSIPLSDYFEIIEKHFECRMKLMQLEELLGQRTAQFRVVQKRLLTKMKDKTPTPLNNLDSLLEATHRQIITLTESIEEFTQELESCCCTLNSATLLITLLIKLTTNMTDDEYSVLQSVFFPFSDVDSHKEWEETVNAAITHMLATYLIQSGKESSTVSAEKLEIMKDINKFKKHITVIVDRILKGARFNESEKSSTDNKKYNKQETVDSQIIEEETSVPIGSRFAERSDKFDGRAPRISAQNSLSPLKEVESKESLSKSESNISNLDDLIEENVSKDDIAFF